MRRYVSIVVVSVLASMFVVFAPAGIIPAIIPAAVPTANRQGSTGAKFFICTGAFTTGNLVSTDANGNCIDSGGTGSGGGGLITYSSNGGLTITAGTYFFPLGGGGAPSTTESDEKTLVQSAALASNFAVQMSAAIGMGNTGAFTLRDNGVDQTVTCTVSGTGAGGTACSDTTHTFNTTAGHTYTVKLVTTGTIAVTPEIQMALQFGTVNTAPVLSVGGLTGVVPGEGNASKVQLFSGADPATNDCAKFDASHNLVTAGAACGSGGGGNTITVGARASLPGTSATTGNEYKTSDAPYTYYWNGASWDAYVQSVKVTEPINTGWTWVNQGSATVATTNGGIYLAGDTTGGTQVRAYCQTAPGGAGAHFTVTALFRPVTSAADPNNARDGGIILRGSTSGIIMYYGFSGDVNGNSRFLHQDKYNSATSFASANYIANVGILPITDISQYRAVYDGTNIGLWWSTDSTHYVNPVTSTASGFGYMAGEPDQICFGVDGESTAPSSVWLLGWTLTTP
jgi:hypothetical protein